MPESIDAAARPSTVLPGTVARRVARFERMTRSTHAHRAEGRAKKLRAGAEEPLPPAPEQPIRDGTNRRGPMDKGAAPNALTTPTDLRGQILANARTLHPSLPGETLDVLTGAEPSATAHRYRATLIQRLPAPRRGPARLFLVRPLLQAPFRPTPHSALSALLARTSLRLAPLLRSSESRDTRIRAIVQQLYGRALRSPDVGVRVLATDVPGDVQQSVERLADWAQGVAVRGREYGGRREEARGGFYEGWLLLEGCKASEGDEVVSGMAWELLAEMGVV